MNELFILSGYTLGLLIGSILLINGIINKRIIQSGIYLTVVILSHTFLIAAAIA